MITLKNIINQTDFDDVWKCIIRHYDVKNENSYNNYKNFYKKLLKTTPDKNSTNMYIYITVFKEGEDGDTYCINNFNEDDNSLYYDVSGGDDENDIYGLEACSFERWLSFYIDQETLEIFSSKNIIAHCLWEITFFGFQQKRDENGRLILD
ncbi:DUF6557 family protein [uncultured Clostridium sp.]|uniref:DUF6557 family protein n=1 Tax=uncultured Clostridium sp. TaxID=59620 RepID=UPI00258E973C|nr:DUF6557 family protein [uncultured Clostridium sp.]